MMMTNEEYKERRDEIYGNPSLGFCEVQDALDALRVEWLNSMEVGDKAHIQHYSDVTPCTIIKKTKTTFTVRCDKAVKTDKWGPKWVVGGFSAHCKNNEDQDDWWECIDDPNGHTEVFRWSRVYNAFRNTDGEKLYPGWRYYHDYNF